MTTLRERYRREHYADHQQIVLADRRNPEAYYVGPLDDEIVFTRYMVIVKSVGDEYVDIAVYEGGGEPEGELSATGTILVGQHGLEVGAIVVPGGRVDWPAGEVSVRVYTGREGGKITHVAFVLE